MKIGMLLVCSNCHKAVQATVEITEPYNCPTCGQLLYQPAVTVYADRHAQRRLDARSEGELNESS